MTNHPNRNKNVRLLNHGYAIARAILADGSLTLISEPVHDGGVVACHRAALTAIDFAVSAYNAGDHDKTIPAYVKADALRQMLREGAAALAARLKAI